MSSGPQHCRSLIWMSYCNAQSLCVFISKVSMNIAVLSQWNGNVIDRDTQGFSGKWKGNLQQREKQRIVTESKGLHSEVSETRMASRIAPHSNEIMQLWVCCLSDVRILLAGRNLLCRFQECFNTLLLVSVRLSWGLWLYACLLTRCK